MKKQDKKMEPRLFVDTGFAEALTRLAKTVQDEAGMATELERRMKPPGAVRAGSAKK